MKPQRPPAFRCPDHGWVNIDRLNISGSRSEIFNANLARLRANPKHDPDTVWDEAEEITSPVEADLLGAFRFYGMDPKIQHPIGGYFADFCFPDERYVVEVDGREWHHWERDSRRDNQLRKHGYTTRRFTGSRVWTDPCSCARQVRSDLDAIRRRNERAA